MTHVAVNASLVARIEELAAGLDPVPRVAVGNESFSPPDSAVWLRATYVPLSAETANVGRNKRVAISAELAVDILSRKGSGDQPALAVADSLTSSLEHTDIDADGISVRLLEAGLLRIGPDSDLWSRHRLTVGVEWSRRAITDAS